MDLYEADSESSGSHLSGTYLSAALEERHPGSFAFEFEDAVVEFLPADQVQKESMDSLTSVLEKLGAICGVSSSFTNLYDGNHAWFQASAALQNGLSQEDNSIIFYFQDYLLPQLQQCSGGRPSWVYYTEGLKRLKKHDDSSQVSYLHTLRCIWTIIFLLQKLLRRFICIVLLCSIGYLILLPCLAVI